MKIFRFKNNSEQYYIGSIKSKFDQWLIIQTIDEEGNLGGLEVIDNEQFELVDKAKEIDFYKRLIGKESFKDIFHLSTLNKSFLKHNFQNMIDVLNYFCQSKMIITVTLNSKLEFSGQIINVGNNQIIMKRRTSSFELSELPVIVDITKIISIAVNDEANIIFQKWLKINQIPNNDICAFYPAYYGDDRFTNYLAGKILAQNNNYFLIQAIDDIGQLNAITVIAKGYIAHVSEENDELDYLTFAVNEQKKNNSFDSLELMANIDSTIIQNKDMKQIILDYPDDKLIAVDDVNFDGQDIGYLSKKGDKSFTMQVINGYSADRSIQFNYEDIVSIDLNNFEIKNLSDFLRQ